MDILRETIQSENVKTMIDLPCGDLNWILDSWETDSLELYLGLDIAKPVIDVNVQRLAHHSNKLFRRWDGMGRIANFQRFFEKIMIKHLIWCIAVTCCSICHWRRVSSFFAMSFVLVLVSSLRLRTLEA